MKNTKIKRSVGQRVLFGIAFLILALHAFTLFFSVAWGFLSSLKTQKEFSLNSPLALPEAWKFFNYVEAFTVLEVRDWNLFGLIFNSLWYAGGGTFLNVTISLFYAYMVVRYPCWITKFHHNWTLTMMMLSISSGGGSMYRLLHYLGVLNSPLMLFAKLGPTTFAYLIFCAAWRGVAWDYAEAAKIDGAGHFTILFKVMIPQVLGVWGALFIMQFITMWNDATASMMYFPDWPTLATGLFEYESKMIRKVNMPVYFAGLMIAMVPVLTLFLLFQETIMEKVNLGGLKG